MSHSSKCSGERDVHLDLFSSRVPVTCDVKTRSYQYSIAYLESVLEAETTIPEDITAFIQSLLSTVQ